MTLCCLLFLCFVAQPLAAARALMDKVMVTVNDAVILQSDFNQALAETKRFMTQRYGKPLLSQKRLEQAVLDQLIEEQLQVQLADRSKLYLRHEELQSTLTNIASAQGKTVGEMQQKLKKEGHWDDFLARSKKRARLHKLQTLVMQQKISISEHEINALKMASQKGNQVHKRPKRYQLAEIIIAVTEQTKAGFSQAEAKVQDVIQQLKSGKDFESLAASVSDAPNALQGGLIGWLSLSRLTPYFRQLVQSMQIGQVSEPVRTQNGYQLIKLIASQDDPNWAGVEYQIEYLFIQAAAFSSQGALEMAAKRMHALLKSNATTDWDRLIPNSEPGVQVKKRSWTMESEINAEVLGIIRNLPKKALSQPIRGQLGYHIVHVHDQRQLLTKASLSTAEAKQLIYQQRHNAELISWLKQIRSQAHIEIR